MSYLDNTVDDAVTYKGKIDESINLLRQSPISSTVSGGTDGEDYEVGDWATLTLTSGLNYIFRAHYSNIGPCGIKHGSTTYPIKDIDGSDPIESRISENQIVITRFDGTNFNLVDPDIISTFIQYLADNGQGTDWCNVMQVGSSLSIPGIVQPAICALNETDVAFLDGTIEELRLYRFNGSTWSLVGSGLSITGLDAPALCKLNDTDVAFIDQTLEELRTYRVDLVTGAWSLVGSGLTISGIVSPSLAALNSTDVAFIDATIEELRLYRFNGSTWSLVGSGLSIAGIGPPSLTTLNATDIAFVDTTLDSLRCYRVDLNTGAWSLVGNAFSVSGSALVIAALNETDVVFVDDNAELIGMYRFDGDNWSPIAHTLSIPTSLDASSIAILNSTDFVFIDQTLEELRTYRWNKKPGKHAWYIGALTGLSTTPSVYIYYSINGDMIDMVTDDGVTGTSNATSFTITGAPTEIIPSVDAGIGFCILTNNSASTRCEVWMTTGGVLTFGVSGSSTGFTSSGTKGIPSNRRVSYRYKLTNP